MKPVMQTILDDRYGNCFQACVSIDAVPDFRKMQRWLCPCTHVCYLSSLHRCEDGNVESLCNRCGERLTAPYGLALNCNWEREQPEVH